MTSNCNDFGVAIATLDCAYAENEILINELQKNGVDDLLSDAIKVRLALLDIGRKLERITDCN